MFVTPWPNANTYVSGYLRTRVISYYVIKRPEIIRVRTYYLHVNPVYVKNHTYILYDKRILLGQCIQRRRVYSAADVYVDWGCVFRCGCHTWYAGDDFVVVTGSRHYWCWRRWIAVVWYGRRCGWWIAVSIHENKFNIIMEFGWEKIMYKTVIGIPN